MNSSVLFISTGYRDNSSGGREMLSRLNYEILKDIFEENFFDYHIDSSKNKKRYTFIIKKIFFGEIDGLNKKIYLEIAKKIKEYKISHVFLDGSNLGGAARFIKNIDCKVTVITFFHNVESKFFFDLLKVNKTFKALAVLIANFFSERMAIKNSDKIFCLTKVDSEILKRIFSREADSILPLSLKDRYFDESFSDPQLSLKDYILFVGGRFYANEYGIKWFLKYVSPYIRFKTVVIGKGFEKISENYKDNENICIIGEVDNIGKWYKHSQFVVAPIFHGSGMKTKVGEALMFGKRIYATKEALIGYELLPNTAYTICCSAEDFIKEINLHEQVHSFDQEQRLRELFLDLYSETASKERLYRAIFR